MKKHSMPFLGIGAASILLVLTVVCLSVFATLTLSGAKGDDTLSRKLADRTIRYYQASNEANRMLAEIDEKLLKIYKNSDSRDDYMKKVDRKAVNIKGTFYDKKKKILSFEKKITGEQKLSVQLKITYPGKEEVRYRVVQWKNEETGKWKRDTSLPVYRKDS